MARIRTIKSYKKRAIPNGVRREVARRYGAQPGMVVTAGCHYCAKPGRITWLRECMYWPMFQHELDHVVPEFLGGSNTADNLVLACQNCNRRKGHRPNLGNEVRF